MSGAKEFVEDLISQNKVVVFGWARCPYCVKVKKLLNSLNISFADVLIEDREDVKQYLYQLTHQETVPNVFVKGKSIGGCDSTHALHDKGGLLPLLN
jgi:glutaredoxin 3